MRSTTQTLYVPADGPVLGQSLFELDNQGASDLALPSSPEPTYAAFGDEAVFLTKNAKGELWLPLASGPQSLLLQSRQPLRRALGFAAGSLAVPHLPVPSTRYAVELRYPDAWVPLYERFGGESRFAAPGLSTFVAFLLLAGWLLALLRQLRVEPKRAVLLAAVLALSTFASDTAAFFVLAAAAVLSVLWLAALVRERKLAPRGPSSLSERSGPSRRSSSSPSRSPPGCCGRGAPTAPAAGRCTTRRAAAAPMAAAKSARLDRDPRLSGGGAALRRNRRRDVRGASREGRAPGRGPEHLVEPRDARGRRRAPRPRPPRGPDARHARPGPRRPRRARPPLALARARCARGSGRSARGDGRPPPRRSPGRPPRTERRRGPLLTSPACGEGPAGGLP